jgi:hypothetical protein
VKSEASSDNLQDLLFAYSGVFDATLRTDANAGDVFVSRPSSSPVSELSFSTTASALPVDDATRSAEELCNQWMSPYSKHSPDESNTSDDSASPPLPSPRVEHGPSAAMPAEPVKGFQLLLGAMASADQPTKENQLCLPDGAADTVVAIGGEAPTARALFPDRERGGRLDPIDEESKTEITSEFDEKVNSGSRVDTPLLAKRVESLLEGRREDLAGITRNLLSPQNLDLIKGAYDLVAGSFFRNSPTNAVDGGTTKEGNSARGMATKDATRPPSDHSSDKADEDNKEGFEDSVEKEDEDEVAPAAKTDEIDHKEETTDEDSIGKAKGNGDGGEEAAGEDPEGEEQEEPSNFKMISDSPNQGTNEGDAMAGSLKSPSQGTDDGRPCHGCVCGHSHSLSDSVYWILCDGCNEWYEVATNCVGFDEEAANKDENPWYCWVCDPPADRHAN